LMLCPERKADGPDRRPGPRLGTPEVTQRLSRPGVARKCRLWTSKK
jgi:hypothetical protein